MPKRLSQHEKHHHVYERRYIQHSHPENASTLSHRKDHDHHGMMMRDFKRRFWISLVLTIPILFLSPMIQMFFHYSFILPANSYFLFILSSVVFFYGGHPFLRGFYTELKDKNPGMMTLIAVAISVAYFYSAAVVFGLVGVEFFWELATLIDIMLLGHWFEMKSVLGASRALELLVKMLPKTAHLVKNNEITEIELENLQANDVVLVKPGEHVPADGKIIGGTSYINESLLTGESKLVKRQVGDQVIGGSINGNGSLNVRIQHLGKDSYLSQVIQLVQQAQAVKSKTQNLADHAARWLTFTAIIIGIITFTIWITLGKDVAFSLERMVTVMVISCPHALGLAVPLVVAISTTLAAQRGLLIRNRTAFENSSKITTLVFDKTGTLTKGNFEVIEYIALVKDYSDEEILNLAASLEQNSEHPIAQGILRLAKVKRLVLIAPQNFYAIVGEGVSATVAGKNIKAVGPHYLEENSIDFPREILDNLAETVVFLLVNEKLVGVIKLADEIRPESFPAIQAFRKNNIKTLMLTGDNQDVARSVSQQLSIDDFRAEVLPQQKLEIIKELQSKGEFVAMAGDGVNDAPALAQADVGIAIGSGTDVAAETADIVLVTSNPQDIATLILFGRAAYRKMMQNLIWAMGYNIIAIPLAAGVLYHVGIILNPAVGAILMSLSTIIVALNAQILRRQAFINK